SAGYAWVFGQVEHAIGVGIGVLLSLAPVLALSGAVTGAWDGVDEWPQIRSLFRGFDPITSTSMRAVPDCRNDCNHSPNPRRHTGKIGSAASRPNESRLSGILQSRHDRAWCSSSTDTGS